MDIDDAPAISAEGVVKRYGPVAAIDGLSLTVGRGEVFTLLGPNGAGKTTTIEILEGYRSPDRGVVRVLGLDPRRDGRTLKPLIGLMLQDGGLYPGIRVGEAVSLFASFYRNPRSSSELVAALGLSDHEDKQVRHLSGGLRQRLNLALALVGRPQLVFLDEPTAGMDPRGRASFWETVRQMKEAGVTVMLTTHLLEEAEALSDRVGIIHRGRLVALGTPGSLTGASAGRLTLRTDPPVDVALLTEVLRVPAQDLGAGRYTAEVPPNPELIAKLASRLAEQGVLLLELSYGSATLEQIFMELTEGG